MPRGFEDTISSASSYYNNQYRNDPGFVRGYAKIHKRELKDTIETKQQRLERHLETQFYLNKQAPGGKVVLFAQVGKYAILAFVMPPVYLFYEGPRWILITIQPFFFIAFEKAGAFLLLISTFGIDFWVGLRKKLQFFKKPKDLFKEKIGLLSQALLKQMAVLGQKIYQVFQPLNKVVEKWKKLAPRFQEKKASFIHFLKILPRLLKKKLEDKKDNFKAVLKEKCAVLLNLLAKVQIPFVLAKKLLNPYVSLMQKQVAKVIKPSLKVATAAFMSSQNYVKKLFEKTGSIYSASVSLIAPPIRLAVKAVKVPFKASVKRVGGLLRSSAKSQKELLVKFGNAVTVTAVIPMLNGIVQIKAISIQVGLNLIQKAQSVYKRLKQIQPIINRVVKTLWGEGKKGFGKFKSVLTSSAHAVAKVIFFCIEKLEKVPSKLYVIWKRLQKWIVRLAKRFVWALRVGLAWTKVILRYSLAHLWD